MSTRLPTQLPAHVDNAPSSLKAARYPQADNCVDNRLPRLLHKNHDTPSVPALRELFKTGSISQNLTREGLLAYREIANRAITYYEAAGKQVGLATQAARIKIIDEALKVVKK